MQQKRRRTGAGIFESTRLSSATLEDDLRECRGLGIGGSLVIVPFALGLFAGVFGDSVDMLFPLVDEKKGLPFGGPTGNEQPTGN